MHRVEALFASRRPLRLFDPTSAVRVRGFAKGRVIECHFVVRGPGS